MIRSSRIKWVLCLVLVFSSFKSLHSQQYDVRVDELLTIGGREDDEIEYIFTNPQHIVTDRAGNIYVADRNIARLKIFDKTGKYVKSIGRRGQGPGEIQEITCLTIDSSDDVIIADRMNRRFTKYSDFGKTVRVYPMFDQSYIEPYFITPYSQNTILVYFAVRSVSGYNEHAQNNILHFLTDDFQPMNTSFASADEVWDMASSFERFQVGKPGLKILVYDSTHIFLAPQFYDGKIYMYEKHQENWRAKVLRGKRPLQSAYIEHPLSDRTKRKKYPNSIMANGRAGRFYVSVKNRTVGLFRFDEDSIIHFVFMTDPEGDAILGMNFFDKKGTFRFFRELTALDLKGAPIFNIEVLWRNHEGVFYVRDSRNLPMIRLLKISLDQE